jgi:hypothetical protein
MARWPCRTKARREGLYLAQRRSVLVLALIDRFAHESFRASRFAQWQAGERWATGVGTTGSVPTPDRIRLTVG